MALFGPKIGPNQTRTESPDWPDSVRVALFGPILGPNQTRTELPEWSDSVRVALFGPKMAQLGPKMA